MMLRSANQSLARNGLNIRNTSYSLLDAARKSFYSTDSTGSEKKDDQIPPLSVRLGAGRGKLLSNSTDDPFASFLYSAQKNKHNINSNRQRNGNFTPRNNNRNNASRVNKKKPAEGQFDDAVEAKPAEEQQPQQRRPKQQRQQRGNNGQQMSSAGNNKGNNNNNSVRLNSNRKTPFSSSKRKPQEVRKTKETEFEDADEIDWSLLDTTALASTTSTTTSAETAATAPAIDGEGEEAKNDKTLANDITYEKYYEIGSSLKWHEQVKAENINQLVGSNATLDYEQKAAFLSTVAKMTAVGHPKAAAAASK